MLVWERFLASFGITRAWKSYLCYQNLLNMFINMNLLTMYVIHTSDQHFYIVTVRNYSHYALPLLVTCYTQNYPREAKISKFCLLISCIGRSLRSLWSLKCLKLKVCWGHWGHCMFVYKCSVNMNTKTQITI